MLILYSISADSLFYAMLAVSFFISYRILNFPDLAMDASYAIGMAIFSRMTFHDSADLPLLYSLLLSSIAGFVVGGCLAILYGCRWLRLGKLLAGLVVAFVVYALNFRINLNGVTHGLFNQDHELNALRRALVAQGQPTDWPVLVIIALLMTCAITAAGFVLRARIGLYLRVCGYRPALLVESGRRPLVYLILGLGLANAITAYVGTLRAASDNYADIGTFGTFLFALASLLIGERMASIAGIAPYGSRNVWHHLLVPVAGGIGFAILLQLSVSALMQIEGAYFGADIRMILGLIIIAVAANYGRRDAQGRLLE